MIDPTLERLYAAWLVKTGDPAAAAMLTAAQVQAQSPAPSAALSVKRAAELLGVSKETVYQLCQERVLPHNKIGRRILITQEQLEEYQAERRAG